MKKEINFSEKFGLVGCEWCHGYGYYQVHDKDGNYRVVLCDCAKEIKDLKKQFKKGA